MTLDEFRAYAGRHHWQNAVKYEAFCPHEYLVKNKFHGEDYTLFPDVLRFVKRNGFGCYYGRKPMNIYLADGEFYYWSMDEDPTDDTVLNRARIDNFIFFEEDTLLGQILRVRYRRRNEPVQPAQEAQSLFIKYTI